jgi:hypothetical protein
MRLPADEDEEFAGARRPAQVRILAMTAVSARWALRLGAEASVEAGFSKNAISGSAVRQLKEASIGYP